MDERRLCVDVVTASRLLSVLMSARLASFDVSLGQLPTLLALYEHDGQTQSELARAIGVEQPTMATNLRRMERDGLIIRIRDDNDARRARVHLTERALEIRDSLQAQREQLDDTALRGLSGSDLKRLRAMLLRMIDNLQREVAGSTSQ